MHTAHNVVKQEQFHEEFQRTDFADGGPLHALLDLPDSWEWATVPKCNGMTLLRKRDAPYSQDAVTLERRLGSEGYFLEDVPSVAVNPARRFSNASQPGASACGG